MDIKWVLLQWLINFLIKRLWCYCYACMDLYKSDVKNENISNKELAGELHKPITRKFKKRKVHSPFIDNIWDADLADM